MEDEQIVKLYLQRNEKALEEAQRKYGAYCFHIARNILTIWEDAEECVNDTWNLSWNKIPPVIPASLKAFLGKLVRDRAVSQYRANHAKKRYRGIELIFEELEECIASRETPDGQTDAIVITDALARFLSGISRDARVIFVRRYWYADSVARIADRYSMSESKVKSSLMRSRNKLKAFLEKEGISV